MCSKEQEFKGILFALCYFHACVAGRLRFGPQGWSLSYPFSPRDLTICANVLYNYLEANPHVRAGGRETSSGEWPESVGLWALSKWTIISLWKLLLKWLTLYLHRLPSVKINQIKGFLAVDARTS